MRSKLQARGGEGLYTEDNDSFAYLGTIGGGPAPESKCK